MRDFGISESKAPSLAEGVWGWVFCVAKSLNLRKCLNFRRIKKQKQSYKFTQRGCPRKKLNPLSRIFSFGSKRFASFFTLFLLSAFLVATFKAAALNTHTPKPLSAPNGLLGVAEAKGRGLYSVALNYARSAFLAKATLYSLPRKNPI